jgi:hypothetical protein
VIAASGIEGQILPWRDVLHEGPVPASLSADELGEARARSRRGAVVKTV